MSKSNKSAGSVKSDVSPKEARLDLVGAALSATCRMVVPTFGFFIIGLLIDAYFQQGAFYGIIGAIVGFAVAGWLIYLQLKRSK